MHCVTLALLTELLAALVGSAARAYIPTRGDVPFGAGGALVATPKDAAAPRGRGAETAPRKAAKSEQGPADA